ncbi:MAG TPA: patatin-like phospholipase family protein [Pyrinomonadaceae bacterium]|nr:patatin-like phospholipase family protein [Pyrinomonadaceae bacterium]
MYPQDESVLHRLLLSEVLLEEYEGLDQPALDQDELLSIKAQIRECRAQYDAAPSSEARDGEIVKQIYRLMANAQTNEALKSAKRTWDEYEERCRDRMQDLEGDRLRKVIERAVVARVFGTIDDLHRKFDKEHAAIKDKAAREKAIERDVLNAIREQALPKDKPISKGTGDGRASRVAGISKEQAARMAARSQRSALCLSGGGIRSATFNLGILQGLARNGLLERFDYLSTVSGGGFIGGWLSAWIHRQGLESVVEQLKEPPKSPLKPEPGPIEYLRIYSNYLSPQSGLLSADTWTLVASVLRNLMLNWFVFMPVLILLLLVPRLWTALLFRSHAHEKYALPASLIVGVLTGMWSFIYIGRHLPTSNPDDAKGSAQRERGGQGQFVLSCLVWLTTSAAAFAIFFWLRLQPIKDAFQWYYYVAVTVAIILVPWLYCMAKIWRRVKKRKWLKVILGSATLLILLAQFITGYLLRFMTRSFLPGPNPDPLFYATFAVPLILLVMCLGGTLIAGFTSRFSNDDDQEWWARVGAWVLIVVVSWSVIHVLVLYGPLMILTLGATLQRLSAGGITNLHWADIGKLAGTAGGVVSGIITLAGGFSAKTPANAKEAQRASVASVALSAVTILMAPVFLGFVFILIALGTNWLLVNSVGELASQWAAGTPLPFPSGSLAKWHTLLLQVTPFRYLIVFALSQIVLAALMGRLINTNNFSLQHLWRNRIIRAYLGASHEFRKPDPFTGFDTNDNLLMHELRPQPNAVLPPGPAKDRPADERPHEPRPKKLLHILNVALNLTGGEKLQWQDRRAESFTVSPFHAGSYWLGYRRSFCYGGNEGISLGAAIAISGAFVSPNMGYMMTSPVVRFLMALFNVRFGTWLGNPGPAGDERDIYDKACDLLLRPVGVKPARPFQLRSPRFSVKPIVSEAFGSIDDKSSYVYLSDGGHFENLGLYEMVLRRCRFIVVSDASTDPDYSFQSLAMSIRQIRVDLGVPIEISDMSVNLPSQDMKSKYCATGKIRYSCVDRDPNDVTTKDADFDGTIIYIKPSLIGEEPRDVVNYWQGSNGFPQEVITDQWFTEAQFESYRALGSHIIEAICNPSGHQSQNKVNFPTFARRARDHNRLDFRAYREQISYAALEQEFKTTLTNSPIASYQRKVSRFISKLLRY